jgi:hypothetical protein
VSARNTSQCFVCGSQPAGAAHYAGPDKCDVRDQCQDGDLANQLKVRELGGVRSKVRQSACVCSILLLHVIRIHLPAPLVPPLALLILQIAKHAKDVLGLRKLTKSGAQARRLVAADEATHGDKAHNIVHRAMRAMEAMNTQVDLPDTTMFIYEATIYCKVRLVLAHATAYKAMAMSDQVARLCSLMASPPCHRSPGPERVLRRGLLQGRGDGVPGRRGRLRALGGLHGRAQVHPGHRHHRTPGCHRPRRPQRRDLLQRVSDEVDN